MTLRRRILNIIRTRSITKTGRLRKKLPKFTVHKIDHLLLSELGSNPAAWPMYPSVRARVSELVKQGYLNHDNARPRKYSLAV